MSKFRAGQTLVMKWPKRFAGKKAVVLAAYPLWYSGPRKPATAAVWVRIDGYGPHHLSGNNFVYPESCFVAANSNGITGYGSWLKKVVKA